MAQTIHDSKYYKSHSPVDFSVMNASNTDVVYKYFKNSLDETGTFLKNGDETELGLSLPTVVFIHGWTTDDTSPWFRTMKDEFFKKGPHNIIYVNWSKAGNQSYAISSANTKPVGKSIAQFLIITRLPPGNIQIIGHSLGSHLSGFIGKYMWELSGKKIGRITALDPAGPKFEHLESQLRLHHDDADFVDVVHTDIEFSGYSAPIGHVDFYPNLGKHQPGCPERDETRNCSHARSVSYFIESLNIKVCTRKAQYTAENGKVGIVVLDVEDQENVIFGQEVATTARGVYCFETNACEPFLKTKLSVDKSQNL